jgi:heme-degrading monooxygenase HmoA
MYVVIFRAKVATLDANYEKAVARLRELAFTSFGCVDFMSMSEGDNEMTLSYWRDEDSIRQWKAHAEHLLAQELGREKWYESYTVQVAEIRREYHFGEA